MTTNDIESMEEGADRYNVPALERGLRLLCEFSRENRALSAPELARRFDLPRSTVFRLLTTLENMGFLERAEGGRDYRLGLAVLRLGFEYLASLELTQLGTPLLQRLCDEMRTPCNLVVRDGRSIVYVAKVAPPTPFASSVTVGTRLPAHATVLGRILLEDLTLVQLRALYPEDQLESFRRHAEDGRPAVRHGPGRPPARLRAGRGLLRIQHLDHRRAGARPQRPHRGGAGRDHHLGPYRPEPHGRDGAARARDRRRHVRPAELLAGIQGQVIPLRGGDRAA